jgi:cardiolipin synthase A/B
VNGRRWSLLAAALLAACSSLPERATPEQIQKWTQALETKVPPATLRAAVGDDPKALEFARRTMAIELGHTRQTYIAGNRLALLEDGTKTHEAQLAAIAKARDHIHLDFYILRDDDVGKRYADLLIRQARAGVKVRLMYDSWGSVGVAPEFFLKMKDAGIDLSEFNSINPVKDLRLWRLNHRRHHKLLVVDGRVAFTGGINVSNEYEGDSELRKSARRAGRRGWRDTQVRIEGPVVAAFQKTFLHFWEKTTKQPVKRTPAMFPPLPPAGRDLVQILTSAGADLIDVVVLPIEQTAQSLAEPDEPSRKKIYASYLAAIGQAQSRVWITQAYFAPDEAFLQTLEEAAARGVDVRVLMPGLSDVGTALALSRHYYARLLKAGLRLYEYEPAVMHAKTAVIDGVWSTVGSSNLDYRSFIHNDEVNAVVVGREFGEQMEKLFLADTEHAEEIKLDKWQDRGFVQRMKEFGALLVKYWI